MLKMVGICLILCGSAGLSLYLKKSLKLHLQTLLEMKKILVHIRNNLCYTRRTIPEVLSGAADATDGALELILREVVEEMQENRVESLYQVWRERCLQHKKELEIHGDELEIFIDVGKTLGLYHVEQQTEMMHLMQEQLEQKIIVTQRELLEKEKVYQSISILGGIFLIIFLI